METLLAVDAGLGHFQYRFQWMVWLSKTARAVSALKWNRLFSFKVHLNEIDDACIRAIQWTKNVAHEPEWAADIRDPGLGFDRDFAKVICKGKQALDKMLDDCMTLKSRSEELLQAGLACLPPPLQHEPYKDEISQIASTGLSSALTANVTDEERHKLIKRAVLKIWQQTRVFRHVPEVQRCLTMPDLRHFWDIQASREHANLHVSNLYPISRRPNRAMD
ncbi:hypothetical protein OIV83_006156 [Microbotryomycetes sp. JL201]|nr:hypothetical protein OIV83_006156 [Microbotryomycetes sp. JL201]